MKKVFITALIIGVFITSVYSQNTDSKAVWEPSQGAILDGKSILKANLSSLFLKGYGFSFERILGKKFSLVVGTSFTPTNNIPYVTLISKRFQSTPAEVLESTKLGIFSVSPELRFYTGAGYGKGFYISPYYRYEKFNLTEMKYFYSDDNGTDQSVSLHGGMTTHNVGLMFGYQWLIGKNKNFVIDWNILGVHAGIGKGDFDGNFTETLSSSQQADVKSGIDETLSKIPFMKATSTVNANNANVKIDGPWGFLRSSLSIGIRL